MATTEISDSGYGMTNVFVSERLFRSFDSTKGSPLMGIGPYQAREDVRMLCKILEIESEVGNGTRYYFAPANCE